MNKTYIYWIFFLIIFVAAAFPIASTSSQTAVFQNVNSEDMWDKSAVDLIFTDDATVPLFSVRNETLFLNIQKTRPRWMLYMEVHQSKWDVDELQSLLKDHPELLKYLPEPTAPNGGIKWVKTKAINRKASE